MCNVGLYIQNYLQLLTVHQKINSIRVCQISFYGNVRSFANFH